jgi:hypothetical protein
MTSISIIFSAIPKIFYYYVLWSPKKYNHMHINFNTVYFWMIVIGLTFVCLLNYSNTNLQKLQKLSEASSESL